MKTFRGTTLKPKKVSFDIVMNLKNTMTEKIKKLQIHNSTLSLAT